MAKEKVVLPSEGILSAESGSENNDDLLALKENIPQRIILAKRGRKTKSSAALSAEDQADIAELYSAKNWERVGSLYFDVRQFATGSPVFELDQNQRECLGGSLAKLIKGLLVINPKYVAGIIFLINFATIAAEKEIKYSAVKKANEPKKENIST